MAKKKKNKEATDKKTSDYLTRVGLSDVTQWASTGCTLLDLAISNRVPGGIPCGRVTHIFGAESTAKSVLVTEPLGSAQRQGGLIWFVDSEGSFEKQRAESLFGLDCEQDSFHYTIPDSIEQLFDGIIIDAIKEIKEKGCEDKPNFISVDSLTSLRSLKEPETLSEKSYGMERAKVFSRAFREFCNNARKVNLGLIVIDQTRTDSKKTYGDKDTTPGGRAVKFYSSVRIKAKHISKIQNENDRDIGIVVEFYLHKNKVSSPFRRGQFELLFDVGIDDVASNLNWLKENDPNHPDGPWYSVGEKNVKGVAKAIDYIEDNDLEIWLQDKVAEVWQEIYKPPERKGKVRREGT